MRILLATDVFPPICGGSGWSTYELARGLRNLGHNVRVVRTQIDGDSLTSSEYDGLEVHSFPVKAPGVPFVQNYFKNERMYPQLARFLETLIRDERIDLAHAQHVLTGPPTVEAATRADVPSVCTVRDYWPVCYWGDLIYDVDSTDLCPKCSSVAMTRCLRPRTGGLWPLTVPLIPYMRANLQLKASALGRADAIIAVSMRIAGDLRARAPEVASTRIETIPNGVDVAGMRATVRRTTRPMDSEYAVFVGKLAHNKGVAHLADLISADRFDIPLVVIGDGPERPRLSAAARRSANARLLGWLPRDEVFRWLWHASFLVFPSSGPESLSRVLLEASALGVAIVAMETGGTGDILTNNETALLSRSATQFDRDVSRLASDPTLRRRLGTAAALTTEARFGLSTVAGRVAELYSDLLRRAG